MIEKMKSGRVVPFGMVLMLAMYYVPGCRSTGPVTAVPASPVAATTTRDTLLELKTAKDLFYKSVDGDLDALAPALSMLNNLGGGRSANPEVVAYSGAAQLLAAKRSTGLFDKARLCREGLSLEDRAVDSAPDNLEIRFLRGVTNYELPKFFGRFPVAESDLAYVAKYAEAAAKDGRLDSRAATADLDYYAKSLERNYQNDAAVEAWRAAARIDPGSAGARDAQKHLAEHHSSP